MPGIYNITLPEWLENIKQSSPKEIFKEFFLIRFSIFENEMQEKFNGNLSEIITNLRQCQKQIQKIHFNLSKKLSAHNKIIFDDILKTKNLLLQNKCILEGKSVNQKRKELLQKVSQLIQANQGDKELLDALFTLYTDILSFNASIVSDIKYSKQLVLWMLRTMEWDTEYVNQQFQKYVNFKSKGYLEHGKMCFFSEENEFQELSLFIKTFDEPYNLKLLNAILQACKNNKISFSVIQSFLNGKFTKKQIYGVHLYFENQLGLELLKFFNVILTPAKLCGKRQQSLLCLLLLKNNHDMSCIEVILQQEDFNTISYCLDLLSNFFLEHIQSFEISKFLTLLKKNSNFDNEPFMLKDIFNQIQCLMEQAEKIKGIAVRFSGVDFLMDNNYGFNNDLVQLKKSTSDLTHDRRSGPPFKNSL